MADQGHIHPAALFARTPAPPGGNSTWASEYGREIRDLFVRQAHREPRSVQRDLGPSELGAACDRHVISKMAGLPVTWHGISPWPSIVGLALDAWLKQYFERENKLNRSERWITDRKVWPHPRIYGTSDVYDALKYAVVDMKAQGPTTQARLKSAKGPGPQYFFQLLLYAWGWRNAGYRVDRVAILSLPRTRSTLAEMYVWDHWLTPEDDLAVIDLLQKTEARRYAAQLVMSRQLDIADIRRTPGDECSFCPWFRWEAGKDGDFTHGCPGTSVPADAPPGYVRPAA